MAKATTITTTTTIAVSITSLQVQQSIDNSITKDRSFLQKAEF